MTMPWLEIIGIGEDGLNGLSSLARALVEDAEIIIGGDRHQKLAGNVRAKRIAWPSPFDAMIEEMQSHRGKRVVILVTGDPLWYSVGARILKSIPAHEIRFHPQLSAFQWAACRMGWSLADIEAVTVHGRAVEQIIPHFAPGVRILALTRDGESPKEVASLLVKRGFSQSRLTVLSSLGGLNEARMEGVAASWKDVAPDFNVLAIECVADPGVEAFSRTGGLPDNAFRHDGQLTKRAVRAATLSALQPYPDALLWDVGAGCGSIGTEWMRAARGARAIAIEQDAKRRSLIEQNRFVLGVPKLQVINGKAPEILEGLESPDAVFIGGGLSREGVFELCFEVLRSGGRLVANAVTLESEARLLELQKKHGGNLDRIGVSEAIEVGRYQAMKPFMSVTQWTVIKP